MKKIIIATILVGAVVFAPMGTYAQTQSVDDSTIEQSLKEQGLDKAPDVVTVPEIQYYGEAPSSGFVDENGKPLSDEKYEKYRNDEDRKGQIIAFSAVATILLLVVGGTIVLVKHKKNKRNASNTNDNMQPQGYASQAPVAQQYVEPSTLPPQNPINQVNLSLQGQQPRPAMTTPPPVPPTQETPNTQPVITPTDTTPPTLPAAQ